MHAPPAVGNRNVSLQVTANSRQTRLTNFLNSVSSKFCSSSAPNCLYSWSLDSTQFSNRSAKLPRLYRTKELMIEAVCLSPLTSAGSAQMRVFNCSLQDSSLFVECRLLHQLMYYPSSATYCIDSCCDASYPTACRNRRSPVGRLFPSNVAFLLLALPITHSAFSLLAPCSSLQRICILLHHPI